MNYRSGIVTGVLATVILAGASGFGWWLFFAKPAETAKPTPPPIQATVPSPLKEDKINAVTLTADAEQRLALKTSLVERKSMKRVRTYGGEVTVPPGRTILVTSPLGGTLRTPTTGVPRPGGRAGQGRVVFELLPLLTPEGRANLASSRVTAEGQVNNAHTQLEAAGIALARARKLLSDMAGSQRMVDEAQAAYDTAKKTLEAAIAQRDLLVKILGETEGGTAAPIPIACPVTGLLRTVSAQPGQTVPAGAALFEMVDLDRVWIRTPVFVGDQNEIDATTPVQIGLLSGKQGNQGGTAIPADAPPAANPLTGTVDLVYDLDNRITKYAPGQKVGVTVPLKGEAVSLTVRWSAVLHDLYGGTWVYEQSGEHGYNRRRIVVRYVSGDTAALASGPAPGTKVVTSGAAELFGAETGFSK